jgi:NO-binding membrane sensor protein with MHYT domain
MNFNTVLTVISTLAAVVATYFAVEVARAGLDATKLTQVLLNTAQKTANLN